MELVRLDPDGIEVGAHRRPADPERVAALAASMKEIGLQTPISVWVTDDNQWVHLVAGRHRLEAAKLLGWSAIDCNVVALDERKRRMWEISENLHRAELSVLERGELEAEWIRLADISAQVEPKIAKDGSARGRPGSGINAAARELGIDRGEAQRAVKIASLAPEAKEQARALFLDDNQSALLNAARAPTPEQQIESLQRHADKRRAAENLGANDRVERQLNRLVYAWDDAGPEARRRFLQAIGA